MNERQLAKVVTYQVAAMGDWPALARSQEAKSKARTTDALDQPESEVPNKNVLLQVKSAKVLCVGAGGIGCELLKTLVLTGFVNIHVV